MSQALLFSEELLLLLLDRDSGQLPPVPGRAMRCAIAGATLLDLALKNRIDTDLEHLFVVDASPVNDDLLDPALAMIAGAAERETAHWVDRLAEPSIADRTREASLERLVERGILLRDDGGFLSLSRLVSRTRRYPTVDGEAGREVELRVMSALFNEEIPAPRDGVLISLIHACGFFERLLSREELEHARKRIELICRLDLIGQAVFEAIRHAGIRQVNVKLAAAGLSPADRERAVAAQPLADGGGLPLAGNAFGLSGDTGAFLARQYRELGPVFRVRAFWRRYTVLAGPEANMLLQRKGRHLFRTFKPFGGLADGLDAHRVMTSMDGSEHFAFRKMATRGYSKGYARDRIETVAEISARELESWPEDRPVPVRDAVQRMVATQVGVMNAGVAPGEFLEDISFLMDRIVNVRLVQRLPEFMLRTPRVRRARERVDTLYRAVLKAHEEMPRSDGRPDLVDDILAHHRDDPQFLPERDLKAICLSPFVVGLHTVTSACAIMIYELLKHPKILARARLEADALFAGEGVTAQKLRGIDVIHRVAQETLRMYPSATALPREVVNTFNFAGHTLPSGTQCLIAIAVPHSLPEFYPEPERFDIDRYAEPRLEHRAPGVYAPFGLGTHHCLGSGFFEVLAAVNIAALLHRFDMSLAPPSYKLKVVHAPEPRPDAGFRIRVARRHLA